MNRVLKASILFIILAFVLLGIPPYEPYVRNLTFEVIPDEKGDPGGGLKLAWEPPWDGPYHGSGCWGRYGDPEDWLYVIVVDGEEIDTTEALEYYLYTPGGGISVHSFDGEYVYEESWSGRLDLEAMYFDETWVWELNGPEESGIFFDTSRGWWKTYPMDTTYRDSIDCYFTDFAQGSEGPFYLTSPSELGNDAGNTWLPADGWRTTGISGDLSGDIDSITVVPYDGYEGVSADSAVAGATYAVRTQEGYYGLIQIIRMGGEGWEEIVIEGRFQPIQGLRWVALGGW